MLRGRGGVVLAVALTAAGCSVRAAPPSPSTGTVRERIAALARGQVAFGSVSLLPVRFERSRIAGPFEEGGRRLYCVSTRMKGRSFGTPERPKLVLREDAGALTILRDEEEVCEGHRSEPFLELDSPGSQAASNTSGVRPPHEVTGSNGSGGGHRALSGGQGRGGLSGADAHRSARAVA